MKKLMKKLNLKQLKSNVIRYLKDPKLLLSFLLAWLITNGWAYVMLGIGMYTKINWMQVVASGYLAILWLPCTPEKLVTIPLSVFIYKCFTKIKGTENECRCHKEKRKNICKTDTTILDNNSTI